MSKGAPANIHTVSAGYVRRFTGPRNTVTVHRGEREGFEEGPRGVGRQRNYWGSPEVASELEAAFGRMESDALCLLRPLPERWPLTDPADRAALGLLVAIHIVRMPASSGEMRLLGERASREILAEHGQSLGLDEQQVAIVAERLRGHDVHADTLLRQVPRIASALCSRRRQANAMMSTYRDPAQQG